LLSLVLALGVLAFLVGLVFVWAPSAGAPVWVPYLPAIDACCNAASALCAGAGFLAIRSGRRTLHRALMLSALAGSAVFLAGYVLYHHFHGETRFLGQGLLRPAYFTLLVSHVVCSALLLPPLLTTVGFAGLGYFERHRRVARWTLPLWLFVSVSGVAVYLFLRLSGSY
jgi:putative membrane protein